MKPGLMVAALASWLTPFVTAAQDAPKKLPPPLKDVYTATDREYASLAFSPEAGVLAVGASGTVRILSTVGGKIAETKVLKQHGRVDELLFDPAVKVLISRSRDEDAQVWDRETWMPVKFAIEDLNIGGLAVRAASQLECDAGASCVVLPYRTRGIRLWNLDGLRKKPRSVKQADVRSWGGITLGHVTAAAWAETALLVGDDQGYLYRLPEAHKVFAKLDDAALVLGRVVRSPAGGQAFRPHEGEVTAIALAAEAKRCVTSGMDGKVRLWDLEKIPMSAASRKPVPVKPEWEIAGQAAEISPDGKLLAVADSEGVGVYQAASGVALSWNPTVATGGRVVRLRFDPDGKLLAGIVCRCSDCAPGSGVAIMRLKRRLADHGGGLVVWK